MTAPTPLHPLDCPVWSALTSHQAGVSFGDALARRLREDIGPFAACADASEAAVAALARLARRDDDMSLLQRAPPQPPPGIELKLHAPGVQMVATALACRAGPVSLEPLGDGDAAAMVSLAQLTRPGPFRAATHTLGRFLGVREGERLVAMAGERLRMDGFIEVSGVCTHPDFRGRGYGAALTRAVADRILADGATPFLHAYASNTGAIELYRQLGFELRCNVVHAIWSKARH